jgi:hypothetical protein
MRQHSNALFIRFTVTTGKKKNDETEEEVKFSFHGSLVLVHTPRKIGISFDIIKKNSTFF